MCTTAGCGEPTRLSPACPLTRSYSVRRDWIKLKGDSRSLPILCQRYTAGMAKVFVDQHFNPDDFHRTEMGASINVRMGLNTWAAFVGTDAKAAIAGDVAMQPGEVTPVLKALRQNGPRRRRDSPSDGPADDLFPALLGYRTGGKVGGRVQGRPRSARDVEQHIAKTLRRSSL